MITLKLSDQEFETLQSLIEQEWKSEYLFQIDGDLNAEWLEEYLQLYRKVITAKYNKGIEQLVAIDLIQNKEKELKEVKGEWYD